MFKGPGDYSRNYEADDLICSIDIAIHEELAKRPPNGYLSQPYGTRS